jgi:hypothetical protein
MSGESFVTETQGAEPRKTSACILENWEIVSLADPKGAVKLCLAGRAFGGLHPLAGENVRTSATVRYRMQGNRLVIVTQRGSEYMLGMRDAPQEQDKRRLIRYLDRIQGASNKKFLQSAAAIETNILGTRDSGTWGDKRESAA